MEAEKGSSAQTEIDIQKEQSVQQVEEVYGNGILATDARAEQR